jgi:hypothetical protein
MEFDVIRDSVMLLLMFLVFGVPAVAIAARLAIRPVVEAIVRLREISTPALNPKDPRVDLLEAEVTRLSMEVQRLSELESFTRQLNTPKQ